MAEKKVDFARGLEGVIVCESKVCFIDGEKGKLCYYGYNIADLARNSSYEETSYLLLYGKLPTQTELKSFTNELLKYRELQEPIVNLCKCLPKDTHPMKALQTSYSVLGSIWDNKDGKNAIETLIAYISQTPILVAAYYRISNNLPIIKPAKELSVAGNFLYMISGEKPSSAHEKVFDKILILHMEHELNASTFTARVIASTLTPVSCIMSGAAGSLYGPLHGGANEGVIEMLDEIGNIENVEKWANNALTNKIKIEGMGHRVYKTKDPRAIIIEELLKNIEKDEKTNIRVNMLEKLEKYVVKNMEENNKKIYPNVDYYSGTLLQILKINPVLFTCIFAIARVVGWSSHINEQWKDNRIYRPISLYQGGVDKKYVSINERK